MKQQSKKLIRELVKTFGPITTTLFNNLINKESSNQKPSLWCWLMTQFPSNNQRNCPL